MPVNMTLLVPTIPGESAIANHVNEIQVAGFDIQVAQAGTGGQATTGSGAGMAQITDLYITKVVDKSTPLLFLACAKGTHFEADVVLTCMKVGGGSSVEYLKISLGQAFISSVKTGVAKDGDVVMETVTFNFKTLKEEYTPQDAKGAALPVIPGSWDIGANQPMG